ncbi:MAG: thioredoxin [Bacteroidaceae bacterium]|nr:thioredoxin [Bacteroidaceae bacterium]MBR4783507.1 thioredoxin [Bacteroidaceae bacterium]
MNFNITDQNYSALAATGKPMVIDFSAEWCGPCRKMAPLIEELAAKYDGKVIIGSCNVDESEELTAQFGIRNIPAIFFIKDGQTVDKVVGAVPAATVEEKVQALL